MTGADHQHTAAVEQAAIWLADQPQPPHPIVPELRARFGLTAVQACETIALANKFRVYRRAHG